MCQQHTSDATKGAASDMFGCSRKRPKVQKTSITGLKSVVLTKNQTPVVCTNCASKVLAAKQIKTILFLASSIAFVLLLVAGIFVIVFESRKN